jgi:hypothetical protein
MAGTAQEITSEIARLQDRLRIARNGLASLNRNLQSNQAIIARYTNEVATIPGQVLALQAQLKSVLPPASAGDIVGNESRARDDRANSNLPPTGQQIQTPTGRIKPAGEGSGTNAVVTPTTESNPTTGTDAELRTTAETQAITNNTSGQLVVAEDGSVSTLRRNPEDGSLYDPGPNAAPVAGPGAGSSEDVGGTVPTRAVSPSPQYQARNQSYVYQAIQVVSSFKQGKFEQSLKGILYTQQTANTTQTNAQQRETTTTPVAVATTSTTKTNTTRPPTTIGDLPVKQQAAIATGTDPNTVNDQGMAFGGGGL